MIEIKEVKDVKPNKTMTYGEFIDDCDKKAKTTDEFYKNLKKDITYEEFIHSMPSETTSSMREVKEGFTLVPDKEFDIFAIIAKYIWIPLAIIALILFMRTMELNTKIEVLEENLNCTEPAKEDTSLNYKDLETKLGIKDVGKKCPSCGNEMRVLFFGSDYYFKCDECDINTGMERIEINE